MTDHVQWSTISIALLVVFIAGLGIWAIVKRIIEEDIEDRQRRDIEAFACDLYCWHPADGTDWSSPHTFSDRFKPRPLPIREPALISPEGLSWLERKLGLSPTEDKE